MNEFVTHLMEESDRGCVLVAASKIEVALEQLFTDIFVANSIPKKLRDRIFDLGGPLSSLSSKTKLAYALGLISKDVFADIEAIRDLRNTFAHSIDFADFLDPGVVNVVRSLHCVNAASPALRLDAPRANEDRQRLSPKQQAKIVADGYITVAKVAFSFGIKILLDDLSTSIPKLSEEPSAARDLG
jgi:DNA-binding MltR family transcriptional regulator